MDSGKPIKESRDVDVPLAANHFWYYAGWADKLEYAFPGRVAKPLGVAAQVIPWNFPLLMLAWKIAPALAAGNTVVLKPASTTPLSALLFAEVVQQADLPPGVVNIVPGPSDIGMHLVSHPDVDKVAFTGSTGVGKLIHKATAGTDKALTLELGGKAANIVFEDAALDQAVEGIVNGIYFNQGEVCCAGSRLLVQESIQGPLIEKLKDRLSTIRVGDPLDKNTDVGAINSKSQLEKITELVQAGVDEGAEHLPAGVRPARPRLLLPADAVHERRPEPPDRQGGDLRAGPVRAHLPHPGRGRREGEQHAYGLSAGVWTEKGSRILWMVRKLKAGVVWANTFNRFDPTSPFGGYKESGFGREGGLPASTPTSASRIADVAATAGAEPRPPPPNGRTPARTDASTPDRRPQDLQAVHRRRSSRGAESGRATSSTRPTARRSRTPCAASRKDLRDAVRAARGAYPGWADRTAMNRGQVLYRVAELMEGRRDQFVAEVAQAEGLRADRAREVVDRSIDRWVWYAGWADKIAQVLGSSNPVASDFFNFTIPEPTGVVGVVAPEPSSLLGPRQPPRAAARRRQQRGRPRLRVAAAAGDLPDRGPRDLRRARGRHQRPDRSQARARAGPRGARGRRRPRRLGRAGRPPDRCRARGGRQREAGRAPPGREDRCPLRLARRPRQRAPRVDRRVPRDEDRLAPDRGVAAAGSGNVMAFVEREVPEVIGKFLRERERRPS